VTKTLIETCGLYGKSKAQWLDINQENKKISASKFSWFDRSLFGEGVTLLNQDEFIALTWKENTILILDRETLKVNREIDFFEGMKQGWGITGPVLSTDGQREILYISDSTHTLVEVDA